MSPTSYILPHELVPVCCLVLAVITAVFTHRRQLRISVYRVPVRLIDQLISDLKARNSWALHWVGLFIWGSFVTFLHFGGYEFQWYSQFGWRDLLTHFISGVGVAGCLLVGLRNAISTRASLSWVFVALLSIGAGFEVYEYIFRSFWHSWTAAYYVQDTVEDLLIACTGAVLMQYWYRTSSGRYSGSDVPINGRSAD